MWSVSKLSDWQAFALAMAVMIGGSALAEAVRHAARAVIDSRAMQAGYVQRVEGGFVVWVKEEGR